MGTDLRAHLRRSISDFGMVVPLVVRAADAGRYETVGGAHRLSVLRDMGFAKAPCLVVEANDAEARLLSQAPEPHSRGRQPGTQGGAGARSAGSPATGPGVGCAARLGGRLQALASLGEDDIARHLTAWQRVQVARLRHLQFQLTDDQLALVEEALRHAPADHEEQKGSPNRKGIALTEICRGYLLSRGEQT